MSNPTDHSGFPRRFDKYILLDRINRGGMAEVFRAKLTGVESFQRLLAIKCMLPALAQDREFVTMFIDEAKLAAQLSHANIVQIHELGRLGDQLYIAMELVNGRDLRSVIKTAAAAQTSVPLPFAAYVIAKAAEGLDFAHNKIGVDGNPLNLVHRDVSPQNILVSYDGEVKVVDFGIAKAEERATHTQAGILKGKFAFMSPEQVTGGTVDHRTDIFALGAVLYEAVTGERLFRGENDLAVLKAVRRAEVPRLSESIEDVPYELQEVLDMALARQTTDRFSSAAEVAEALSPLLIHNRVIFGAKHASEFMRQLFAEEIQALAERTREYARITEADCVLSGFAESRQDGTGTEVLGPAFDSGDSDDEAATEVGVPSMAGPSPEKTIVYATGGDFPDEHASAPQDGSTQVLSVADAGAPDTPPAPTGPSNSPDADKDTSPPREDNDWGVVETAPRAQTPDWQNATMILESSSAEHPPVLEPPPADLEADIVEAEGEEEGSHGVPPATALPWWFYVAAAGLGGALLIAVLVLLFVRVNPPAPTAVVEAVEISQELSGRPANEGSQGPDGAQPSSEAIVEPVEDTAPEEATAVSSPKTEQALGEATAPVVQAKKSTNATRKVSKDRKMRFGYIWLRANGVATAKVFINGKEVGYSPLVNHRLPLGKHKVRIVEELQGGSAGRAQTLEITVSPKHTRQAPKKIVVSM